MDEYFGVGEGRSGLEDIESSLNHSDFNGYEELEEEEDHVPAEDSEDEELKVHAQISHMLNPSLSEPPKLNVHSTH